MKILKQSVGIDCSKQTLDTCFSVLGDDFEVTVLSTHVFPNNMQGYKALLRWSLKLMTRDIPLVYVVEATGTYHEHLSHFLYDSKKALSVVLPSLASRFAKTLKSRTVTDKQSSKMLAMLGLEKKLDLWQQPDAIFAALRKLCREREQLQKQSTRIKNQLHASSYEAFFSVRSTNRLKQQVSMLDAQINEVEEDIQALVNQHPELKARIDKVCTIKGVGFLTAVTIVAETCGFNLIRNKKQLVSYAGYDIVEKQSGSSVRGKSHVSKKGNSHIKRALHYPALQSVRHSKSMEAFYKRVYEKNKIKMKSYTAVQRKLLILIYTLWKNNSVFEEQYKNKQGSYEATLHELDLVRS